MNATTELSLSSISAPRPPLSPPARLLFVGGLHRSGTTLVARALGAHGEIATLCNTGRPEDEGQHVQDVYAAANRFGGAGRFAFAPAAHLTEAAAYAAPDGSQRLWRAWHPYWNRSAAWYLEKSPPNLIHARYLQALFPAARFLMVIRHPVAVALATQKWSWTTLESLLAHWEAAHQTLESDRPFLRHVRLLRYEDFVHAPAGSLRELWTWLDLPPHEVDLDVRPSVNEAYFARWRRLRSRWWGGWRVARMERRFGPTLARYGYSFEDALLT